MFKRREEGLKKKDLELQESLIRFSKFLQENDAKRMHALKKAQDERKIREEKEREVEQLVREHIQIPHVPQPITRQVAAMLSACAACHDWHVGSTIASNITICSVLKSHWM